MTKQLSIVISVYNKAHFIEQCIKSILELDIDKTLIEAIFVDDASTDRSVEIIRQYETLHDWIKLIVLEENSGSPAMPRNVAMQAAQGTYITILDADDWLDAQGLPRILEQAITHNADIAFGQNVKHTDDVITKMSPFVSYKEANGLVPYEIDKVFRSVGPPGKLFKRAIVQQHHITFKHMRYGEDKLFFIELISRCKQAAMSPLPMYHVNRYDSNASLVGETSAMEKADYNLDVLDAVLAMTLPERAKFAALSRIVEMDFISRLFVRQHFLKHGHKQAYYDVYQRVIDKLAAHDLDIASYIEMPKLKKIHMMYMDSQFDMLVDYVTDLVHPKWAGHYIDDTRVYLNVSSETERDYGRLPEDMYPIYKGTHHLSGTRYEVIDVFTPYIDTISEVRLVKMKDALYEKTIDFTRSGHTLYIKTEDVYLDDVDFNIVIIFNGYMRSLVYATYPSAAQTPLNRKSFKVEFKTAKKSAPAKAKKATQYITDDVSEVIVKRKFKLYEDADFKNDVDAAIELGEVIRIKEHGVSKRGTPRLVTDAGYYITANMDFVAPRHDDKDAQYITTHVPKVKVIKPCKVYRSRNFDDTSHEVLATGTKIDVEKIIYSTKGTPRLKTTQGTFITANKDFVKPTSLALFKK